MGLDLDVNDVAIFNFIRMYSTSKAVQKTTIGDKLFYNIPLDTIIKEMPMLGLKKRAISDRVNKLVEAGLLERYEGNQKANKSYLCFGPRNDEYLGYTYAAKDIPMQQNAEVPMQQNAHKHSITNHSINNIYIGQASLKALPANKFFLSSTERDAVLNNPDRIAEIKMQHFVARTKGAAAEVGMDEVTFQNFVNHWCEHSDGSEHIRCEDEKFFDVKKRMKTWMSRSYNKPSSAPPQEKQYSKPHVWTQEELDNLYK